MPTSDPRSPAPDPPPPDPSGPAAPAVSPRPGRPAAARRTLGKAAPAGTRPAEDRRSVRDPEVALDLPYSVAMRPVWRECAPSRRFDRAERQFYLPRSEAIAVVRGVVSRLRGLYDLNARTSIAQMDHKALVCQHIREIERAWYWLRRDPLARAAFPVLPPDRPVGPPVGPAAPAGAAPPADGGAVDTPVAAG